ncbi:serine hydrolase domain-containing protein [Ottowia sp.]|uniref:serine hydrolase domain-containing protein n=1 Tax=Ottowia sp. TaxID=1898956 RepID=UPI0039E4E681
MNALVDDVLVRGVESGSVPGVVAAVTNRDVILYEAAFGKRALGGSADMTVDTVAWIASMTKALTTTAAMRLVEQGKLDLDSPLAHWMAAFHSVGVLEGFDEDGKPRIRQARRPITLRHLLTHTSGFGYTMWSADLLRYKETAGLPGITTCRNAALHLPLLFEPGEGWEYGIGLDWVGKIVEAVSGKKLGVYLHDEVLAPLGMADTAFKMTPSMRARLATVHQRDDGGELAPTEFGIPQEPEFEMGGGGLYSTASDYLKFIRMVLNGGKTQDGRILKAATVAEMSRNQIGDLSVHLLKTVAPSTTNDAEFFPGMRKTWGLGFMINSEVAPTGRSPGSLAWAGLANTYFWIDPIKGIGGVYLTQLFPFADHQSTALFLAFEKAAYEALKPGVPNSSR